MEEYPPERIAKIIRETGDKEDKGSVVFVQATNKDRRDPGRGRSQSKERA